jgi:hypothetical protein
MTAAPPKSLAHVTNLTSFDRWGLFNCGHSSRNALDCVERPRRSVPTIKSGLLQNACGQTEHWRLDFSHTEAGDPWCIMYDERQRRTVFDISRIDDSYVVAWPSRGQTAKTGTMADAVELALARLAVDASHNGG